MSRRSDQAREMLHDLDVDTRLKKQVLIEVIEEEEGRPDPPVSRFRGRLAGCLPFRLPDRRIGPS